MKQSQKDILQEIYDCYSSGKNYGYYSLTEFSHNERETLKNDVSYLQQKNYIKVTLSSNKRIQIEITASGIDFAESGFTPPDTFNVHGNNNICISGSSNHVSDCYNDILIDVAHSDLSPETKELLETLIEKLQNHSLSNEQKSNSIRQFLHDFTEDSLSATAASGLTQLLTILFNHLFH